MKRVIASLLLMSFALALHAQQTDTQAMAQQLQAMQQRLAQMEARIHELENMPSVPQPPTPPSMRDTIRRKVIIINGERIDSMTENALRGVDIEIDSILDKGLNTQDKDDSVVIKMGGLRLKVDNDDNDRVIIKKEKECNGCSSSKHKPDDTGVEFTALGLKIGLNNYLSNGSLGAPKGYDALELRTGKSVDVNIGLAGINWHVHKNYVTLHAGVGLDINNYRFGNNAILIPKIDSVAFQIPADDQHVSKNKLTDTYVELPVRLQFATNNDDDKAFRVAIGGRVGYLIGSHNKLVINDDKKKVRDDFNLNPFRYGMELRVGYGWVDLYLNYDFSPLFRNGVAPNVNPVAVGLAIGNF